MAIIVRQIRRHLNGLVVPPMRRQTKEKKIVHRKDYNATNEKAGYEKTGKVEKNPIIRQQTKKIKRQLTLKLSMAQETNAWIHSQIIEAPELTTRNIVSKKKTGYEKELKR